MHEDLAAALRTFDGKRVEPFRVVAESLRSEPDAIVAMIDLAANDDLRLQVGATWVLKDLAEHGMPPAGQQVPRYLELLGTLESHEGVLHVLQTLPHVVLTDAQARRLRPIVTGYLDSANTFVRAWAYNAMGLLAARDPELRPEVERLFDEATEAEPPSVRARIRHARKLLR